MIRVTVEEITDDYRNQRVVCFFEVGPNGRRMVTPSHEDFVTMYSALNGMIYETAECSKSAAATAEGHLDPNMGAKEAPGQTQESHPKDEPCQSTPATGIPNTQAGMEEEARESNLRLLQEPGRSLTSQPGKSRRFTL